MSNEYGHAERIGPVRVIAEDGTLPPLRMSHLLIFLSLQGRSTKCPYCEWNGGWEVALHEDGEDIEDESGLINPRLEIITHGNIMGGARTTVAMTCPNCGNFAEISTYKIREVLSKDHESNG
ncbi:hypothetical protein [Pseudomonas helleri]|uniref:hypothetical protein n=1 Tax=Pseudomonas helleri TaxID=1608996 RepID=UPI003FD1DCA2